MPTIVLKTTHTPADSTDRQPSQSAGPLLRGNGDTDYLCGNCGFVIAAGIGSNQRVALDSATCSSCGAENELPPELRC
jgi:DNA-directed RNA polymerase subunit RPC12/RpoP